MKASPEQKGWALSLTGVLPSSEQTGLSEGDSKGSQQRDTSDGDESLNRHQSGLTVAF